MHPSTVVVLGFAAVIALATLVLMLPVSRAEPGSADWLTALFTATSAVCVTGLTVVDTGSYWSPFGQVALLVMFQVGGFGIMTTATLLGLWVTRSMRLRARLQLQAETRALALGDVRSVVRLVLIATFAVEALIALALTLRFGLGLDMPWPRALWLGVFHAISAFNNAGFSPFADNMVGFVGDPLVLGPLMLGVVIGGLGFPVLHELWTERRRLRHCRLSLHAQITLAGTLALLVLGTLGLAWSEWNNPKTLAPLATGTKWLAALFTSVVARTAGFNAIDLGALNDESYVLHYLLMYIGAGSAGTGGGVKIATFAVLLLAVWSDIRGNPDIELRGRRIAATVLRQALTVLVLSAGVIVLAMLILVPICRHPYPHLLFEVISAFATVGVSAGITAQLPPAAKLVLVGVMFIGRVGIVTLAVALAAKTQRAAFRFPEEKPIVG